MGGRLQLQKLLESVASKAAATKELLPLPASELPLVIAKH